ncbi:WPP domain-interacting protein 2, putative isoform 1 [Theobroma cacao]|uniref:WPP domain-interacting protein 2, putative isoform 1 n=1 Tax=Theobroma cacao TaxID=3641 RepID=A0A061EGV5_THECC|nr:WPP domain-interacting protein 2, putative isoform 1 [Theobroma cacao]EOY01539.1 WPP domain-interacting protein 2, putative isoform 1 [Theobroma cacao]EOY01541.1 WPP domain-interacting protein 2, putative isoform 1 [Theobroma cacao]
MEINEVNVGDKYMQMGNPELDIVQLHEEASSSGEGIQEMQNTTLSRIDLDLAYSNEKLVNLHVLLMLLLGWDNDPEAMASGNSDFSAQFIEKALVFDLLCGILDSELREVETFLDTVQAEIVDARHKISSSRPLGALFNKMEEKLHDSEQSLEKCQELVLEVKMQSTKLQDSISYFRHENWNNDKAMDIAEQYQLSNIIGKSKVQTVEQQRHILRMLEKSLARELDLEKKLSEFGQNEEQLKLKLHYTEQVALRMEEAAEVVWGRFLEAENAAEVLMGISKELVGRLQIVQFNLNGSIQREAELKSKLEGCIEELNTKDIALKKLESSNAEHAAEASEVFSLRKKVKLLEEQLKESKLQLNNANASNQTSQEHIHEMEIIIDSLKENIYEAESRSESAEAKVTELTDANLELTEELNFLKGNNDNNTEKVTSLEKQLREKEIQLQHAKASSDASQEQQNMLYSAIWDMETLIEDLKSKVSKAESKTDTVEEQCIILSESNFELNNELGILRNKIECLETSLDQANNEKEAIAKEINYRTKLITDMVTQLATERERIQKQLFSLVKEKAILVKKLQNTVQTGSLAVCNSGVDGAEISVSKSGSIKANCTKTFERTVLSATSVQVNDNQRNASLYRTEVEPSGAVTDGSDTISRVEVAKRGKTGHLKLIYIFIAILIALFSALAVYLLRAKPPLLVYF